MQIFKTIKYVLSNYKTLESEIYLIREENKYLKSRIKALNQRVSALDTKIYDMDDFIDSTILNIKD